MTAVQTTPATQEGQQSEELLLDRWLPRFDVTARVHLVVEADRETTWRSLLELDLMQVHSLLLDAAVYARGLPTTLAARLGRRAEPPPPPEHLRIADPDVVLPGWLALGTLEGQEVALGAVGRFWRPDIEWYDVTGMQPEDFASFDLPGWGRIAAGFSLRPYGRTRTLATYEARTALTDDAARRRFAVYWGLVHPFVGHVLRATLRTLADDAAGARAPV